MSKSLGNVLLVHDMVNDGIKGEAIRFAMLSTHYRQPFDWTAKGLSHAKKTLDKWYKIIDDVPQIGDVDNEFLSAMCDDINTPLAISVLHKIAKETPESLAASAQLLGVLNIENDDWFDQKVSISEDEILDLIDRRNVARANKNFVESDNIRDELLSHGVVIKDNAQGTSWSCS